MCIPLDVSKDNQQYYKTKPFVLNPRDWSTLEIVMLDDDYMEGVGANPMTTNEKVGRSQPLFLYASHPDCLSLMCLVQQVQSHLYFS